MAILLAEGHSAPWCWATITARVRVWCRLERQPAQRRAGDRDTTRTTSEGCSWSLLCASRDWMTGAQCGSAQRTDLETEGGSIPYVCPGMTPRSAVALSPARAWLSSCCSRWAVTGGLERRLRSPALPAAWSHMAMSPRNKPRLRLAVRGLLLVSWRRCVRTAEGSTPTAPPRRFYPPPPAPLNDLSIRATSRSQSSENVEADGGPADVREHAQERLPAWRWSGGIPVAMSATRSLTVWLTARRCLLQYLRGERDTVTARRQGPTSLGSVREPAPWPRETVRGRTPIVPHGETGAGGLFSMGSCPAFARVSK